MGEIKTKIELQFYIEADRMMNRGCFKYSIIQNLKMHILPDYISLYLKAMRKASFYSRQSGILNKLLFSYWKLKHYRLGIKLGYDIGYDTLGYGVVLGHAGTIIIGSSNRIGNYAVIHTSTCITNNGKKIGNGLYLGAGSILTSPLILGDNVSVGANSLVNKSFEEGNVMIAGSPAVVKKSAKPWYNNDIVSDYAKRYIQVENKKNRNK